MAILNNTLTCTPHALLNDEPCGNCSQFGDSDLLIGLAYILFKLAHGGAVFDATQELSDSACFRCVADSRHKMLEILVTELAGLAVKLGYFENVTSVLEDAKCLKCSPPGDVKGMILYELCQWVNVLGNQQLL